MTTPAPTKRSVGRPRKNAKKQENPDCEVAVPQNNNIDFRDFAVFAGNWKKGKVLKNTTP